MASDQIQLLQFFVCREFKTDKQDSYTAEGVASNIIVPSFPFTFENYYVITCWRKDERFHKEVIEYATDHGVSVKTPHMDIEPVTSSVYFRWHRHQFPLDLVIDKTTYLSIKVILDWKVLWESYLLVEGKS